MNSIPKDVQEALFPSESVQWIGKSVRSQRSGLVFIWFCALVILLGIGFNPETGDPIIGFNIAIGILIFGYCIIFFIKNQVRFIITNERVITFGPGEVKVMALGITKHTKVKRIGGGLKIKNLAMPNYENLPAYSGQHSELEFEVLGWMDRIAKKIPFLSQPDQMTFFEIDNLHQAEQKINAIIKRKQHHE